LLTSVVFVVAALGVAVVAQNADAGAAERLTGEGARAFKDGRFEEARKLFERALELVPASEHLPLAIARTIERQYRPGLDTPENRARAEEAIKAYMRVFESPHVGETARLESFIAMVEIHRRLGDEERERGWLRALSDDSSVAPAKRAVAYVLLASERWYCSYNITETTANKQTMTTGGKLSVGYLKPKAPGLFEKAQACAAEGLGLAEQALALNPSNIKAWAYKTNLLRERAKLAEMDEDSTAKAEYERLAAAANAEFKRLREEEEARIRAADSKRAGPVGPVNPTDAPADDAADGPPPPPRLTPDPTKRVVIGGVLNGKAVYKPAPSSYPRKAREAGASGVVTVEVIVDEEGRVASAEAVGGHELLREAAVKAARQWRFTPTLLSGQPVKVSGRIIFAFSLN
jgi:TonB family protein